MIEAVNKKYCNNNLIQLMHRENTCNLIVSDEEILLLRLGDKVIINSYENHPDRSLFPYSDKAKNGPFYNELFEYRKPYLVFSGNYGGFNFELNYFFKGNDRALFWSETLQTDRREVNENEMTLSREEIENLFNKDNYDSMYVIDVNGKILYASNPKNGVVVSNQIIPSDEEIIEKDYLKRIGEAKMKSTMRRVIRDSEITEEDDPSKVKRKTIEEIKDLTLYNSSLFDRFGHMMLTSKNGEFSINWFKIKFIEKDKFKLIYQPIYIKIPTNIDVINYLKNNKIEFTLDPSPPCKSFEEVHTPENMEFARNSILKLMEELDNPEGIKEETPSLLRRLFSKKEKRN